MGLVWEAMVSEKTYLMTSIFSYFSQDAFLFWFEDFAKIIGFFLRAIGFKKKTVSGQRFPVGAYFDRRGSVQHWSAIKVWS